MEMRTKSLLAVGIHLRHLMSKRALPSAMIDKACCLYYEYLYSMRNSTASVTHQVLHFTTYNIKGRSKLGETVNSIALASNIGCELVDFIEKKCKTVQLPTEHGTQSVAPKLDTNTVQNVSETTLPSSDIELGKDPSAGKAKKSRWKRYKEKMVQRSALKKPIRTTGKQPTQRMDTDVSVDEAKPSSAVDQLSLIPDGPRKIVTTPVTQIVKEAEEAIRRAGYAAKQRLDSGQFHQIAQDVNAMQLALALPRRLPLSREMELQVHHPQPTPKWASVNTRPRPCTTQKQTVLAGPAFKPPKKKAVRKQKGKLKQQKRPPSPISTRDKYCY